MMKLSAQAVGAIMMVLQKGIQEQIDITQLLLDFDLAVDANKDELVVLNAPILQATNLESQTVN